MSELEIDNSLSPNRKRSKYLRRYIFSVIPSVIFQTKHSFFLPQSETKNLQQCLMAALNANKRIMASHENLSRLEKKRKKENRRTADGGAQITMVEQ